eukprot:2164494-Rhodomonas_salina.1
MRRGCISTAIAANVPEEVRKIQLGHKSDSWEEYAELADIKMLYAFSKAFKLGIHTPYDAPEVE